MTAQRGVCALPNDAGAGFDSAQTGQRHAPTLPLIDLINAYDRVVRYVSGLRAKRNAGPKDAG